MTHLTSEQFVDALEGAVPAALAGHLERCAACRQELASVRGMLGTVRDVPAADPSPLFWEHLSQRIRVATDAEPISAASWWQGWLNPSIVMGLAVATMALVFVVRMGPGAPRDIVAVDETALSASADNSGASPFVVDMAAALPLDDVREIARPTADAAGAVMGQLTPAQRAEFIRLVKAQMNGAE